MENILCGTYNTMIRLSKQGKLGFTAMEVCAPLESEGICTGETVKDSLNRLVQAGKITYQNGIYSLYRFDVEPMDCLMGDSEDVEVRVTHTRGLGMADANVETPAIVDEIVDELLKEDENPVWDFMNKKLKNKQNKDPEFDVSGLFVTAAHLLKRLKLPINEITGYVESLEKEAKIEIDEKGRIYFANT